MEMESFGPAGSRALPLALAAFSRTKPSSVGRTRRPRRFPHRARARPGFRGSVGGGGRVRLARWPGARSASALPGRGRRETLRPLGGGGGGGHGGGSESAHAGAGPGDGGPARSSSAGGGDFDGGSVDVWGGQF